MSRRTLLLQLLAPLPKSQSVTPRLLSLLLALCWWLSSFSSPLTLPRLSSSLPAALLDLRQHGAALDFIEEVDQLTCRVLGPESPMALISSHVKALAMAGVGRRQEACTHMRRVHGSRVSTLGERHESTLEAASDLGEMLGRAKATRVEARALLLATIAAAGKVLSEEHVLADLTQMRLAKVEHSIALDDDGRDDDDDGDDDGGERVALLIHIFVAASERRRGAARAALPLLAAEAWAAGADAMEALVPIGCAEGAALLEVMLEEAGFTKRDEFAIRGTPHARVRLERPPPASSVHAY